MRQRAAFYALPRGAWRDYVTILHAPYTVWHLSYVAIGAALAPAFSLGPLLWMLLAFFLAMGIGAHALDELKGRPLNTAIPDRVLWAATAASLSGAVAIGAWWSFRAPEIIPFVILGPFLVVAYNQELLGGVVHNRLGFALSWGVFPAAVGYVAQGGSPFSPGMWLAALGLGVASDALRVLSLRARFIRRKALGVSGHIIVAEPMAGQMNTACHDHFTFPITHLWVTEPIEVALERLSYAMPLAAVGFVISRLIN